MIPLPRRLWVRVVVVLLVVLLGTALAMSVELPEVTTLRSWLRDGGPERWVAVVLGVAVALLTPISRTALSLLVGAVAGFPAGLAVALSGGLLGGLAGFSLSRWLGREAVTRLAGARRAAVDRVISERGFTSVLAARIMPVAPFVVVSYAAGLSGIRLGPYVLGTALGLVPWSLLYVGIGASVTGIPSWGIVVDVVLPVGIAALLALLGVGVWWRRHRAPTNRPPRSHSTRTAVATADRRDDASAAGSSPSRG